MKKPGLLIAGILLFQICFSQGSNRTDWNSDLDFLAKELPARHYDLFTVRSKNEFLAGIDHIKKQTDRLNDLAIAIRIQQLIAGFGDSHTNLNFSQLIDKNKILPLHLYWFSDGLYILQTTQDNIEILGHRILTVNGVPLERITDSLSTLFTIDNHAIVKYSVPKMIPAVQVLEYFGFAKNQEIELGLKDLSGETKNYIIKPAELNKQNRERYKPDSLALCYQDEKAFFTDYFLKADRIYYIQYNRCWSKELELRLGNAQNAENMPSFKAFEKKVFRTLKNKQVDKVVFDIRFNGGGSSPQGTELIEKYAKYLKKNPSIKTYVITGRNTFSSAVLNAMDLKRLTNAVFVGEETAGKPNHFGEVKAFQLPGSGIAVNYSTKYFRISDKEVNTIVPDIQPETGFSDFKSGIDPAYEWIKKQP